MKKSLILAALAFVGLVGVTLAGAPPCPEEAAPSCSCKPVVVEAPSCSAAPSCSGEDRGGCHGRQRSTFAERRANRLEGRCAAREARAEARASCSGRSSCSGEKVVVVQCCPTAACCPAAACGCK